MTIPLEEIYKEVKDMNYIIVNPRHTPVPSFYKLDDGTMLGILTRINHLIPNPMNTNDISTNLSTQVFAFVPENKRNPNGKQEGSGVSVTIIEEDVEYETLKEDFNTYDLSNDIVLSLKTVLGQVQKTDIHTNMGEPIYNINSQPVIKIKKSTK